MTSDQEVNFETQADRQGQRYRLCMTFVACGMALVGGAAFGPSPWTFWMGVPGTLSVLVGMAVFFSAPARCDRCHHTLDHYKTRNYVIHFCTHCGTLLEPRGVQSRSPV